MPTRKIADLPEAKTCRDPEHFPPAWIVMEPGIYEHTCPRCGFVTRFTVPRGPTMKSHYRGWIEIDTAELIYTAGGIQPGEIQP